MLALPCCRRGGSVDWDGDAAGVASATGSEGGGGGAAPSAACAGGGGGGAGARVACPPPSCWPWGVVAVAPAVGTVAAVARGCSGPPRCGRIRPGATLGVALPEGGGGWGGSCRAAGSTKAPASAGGEGGVGPGAAPRPAGRFRGGPAAPPLGGAPTSSAQAESARGAGFWLCPPPAGWGNRGSVAPPPTVWCDIPPGTPPLARLGVWRFAGLEEPRSKAGGGRVPSTLGGAAHRRAAGGPESGRACDARRARPSQEDNAAAPARRASGTSTWRPGATRGGATGQLEPPEGLAWPTWPARQQRLMPQPRLLQRAHDGAPCSKQSAPYVPLPAPGGRLRCGAARGTLLAGARGGRRA